MLKEHLKKHFKRIKTIKLKRHHYILGGFGIAAIILFTSIFGFQKIGTYAEGEEITCTWSDETTPLTGLNSTGTANIICTTQKWNTRVKPFSNANITISGGTITGYLVGNEFVPGNGGGGWSGTFIYSGTAYGTSNIIISGIIIDDNERSFMYDSMSAPIEVIHKKPECSISAPSTVTLLNGSTITVTCTGDDNEATGGINWDDAKNSLEYNINVFEIGTPNITTEAHQSIITYQFTGIGARENEKITFKTGMIVNPGGENDATSTIINVVDLTPIDCTWDDENATTPIGTGQGGTINLTCNPNGIVSSSNLRDFVTIQGNSIVTGATNQLQGEQNTITIHYTGIKPGTSYFTIEGQTGDYRINQITSTGIEVRGGFECVFTDLEENNIYTISGAQRETYLECDTITNSTINTSDLIYSGEYIEILSVQGPSYENDSTRYTIKYKGKKIGDTKISITGGVISNGFESNEYTTSNKKIYVYEETICSWSGIDINPITVGQETFIELRCEGSVDRAGDQTNYTELRHAISYNNNVINEGNILLSGNATAGTNILKVYYTGGQTGNTRLTFSDNEGFYMPSENERKIIFKGVEGEKSDEIIVEYGKPTCTITGDTPVYINKTGKITISCIGLDLNGFNKNNIINNILYDSGIITIKDETRVSIDDYTATVNFDGLNTGNSYLMLNTGTVTSNGQENNMAEFSGGIWIIGKDKVTCNRGYPVPNLIEVGNTGDINFTCTGTNDSYTGEDFTGVEINYEIISNYIGINGDSIATINTGISETGITLIYTGLRGGISNYYINGESTTQTFNSEPSENIIVRTYTGLCSISATPERVEVGSGGKIIITCQGINISPILYRSGLEYDSGIINILDEYAYESNGRYEFGYSGNEAGLSEVKLKAGQIIADGIWMNNQVHLNNETDGIVVYSKANCERGDVYPSNPIFVNDTGYIELICTGKIDWTNSNKTTYNELRGIIRTDDQDGALETGNIILSGDNPTEGRNILKVNFTGEAPGIGRFSIDGTMGNAKSGQIMFTDNQTRSTGIVVQYKKPTCTIEGDNEVYINSTGIIIVTCTGHGNELIGTISRSELNYNNIIEIISEQTGTESAIFIYKGNNTGYTDVTLDSGVVYSNGEQNEETEFEGGVTVKDKEQITCTWSGASTPINVNETGDIELKCTGDINEVLTTGTVRNFVTLSGSSIEANIVSLITRTDIGDETFKFLYTGDHGGISNFVISGETADSIILKKTSEDIYVISEGGFACNVTAEPDTVKPGSGGKIKIDCPEDGTYNRTVLNSEDLIYSDRVTVSSTSESITSDKDFIFLYTGEEIGHTELILKSGVIIKDNIYYNTEKAYNNGITVRNETECSRGNGQEVNEGEAGYLTLTCTGLLGNNISTNEDVNLNNLWSIITKDGNSIETGNITVHNYNSNGTNTIKVHFTGISQGITKLNISGTIDENFYISDNGVTTGIVNVLGDKPECSIRAEPDIIPKGLSGIIKIECGGTDLGDIVKAKIDYSGAIISILETSVPAVQSGTSSIYTFHYTGEQVGRTKLGLKTGAVHNGTVQNDYAESEYGIYVMENSHLECRRTDLTNNAIEIRGTGKITLDCGRSGNDSVKHPEKRILRLVETVNDTGKIAFTTGLSFAQGINFTGIEVGSTHFYLSGNLNEYITVRAGESEEIKVYAQNGIQTGCTWETPVPNQITIGQTGKINLNCNNITINTETPNEMWDIIDLDNEPNNEIIINTGNIRIIENENKIEFEYEGNHTGTTKLFASGSYGGMYIESANRSTPIKVIDSSKPLCTISGDTIVGLLGTGEIRVICYDINGITTTQLNSGTLEYTDEISVGNSTIVGGTGQEKTFTFTFTGSHTGTTAIAIRTGKVLNTLNDGNDYTTGENIKVVDSYTCHRETPQPQILRVGEIGTMTLECGLLHVNTIDENIGSILIRSGDSVTGNLNNFVLSYTGERTGTTNFAISGIIQGIIVKTEPLRSSGITVYPANTNMILSISPEGSIFNNQIIVHMTGLYANEVKYKTGRNLSYDQCMEGESLNQNNTTYTGEITISESTTLYLCGEGIFGDTGMEIEEYIKNSDTTKPNCTISGTEMVLSGGIGTITVECYDTNGILTNQLDSGDLAFNEIDGNVISVGNSTITSETDTGKTFTFTFTGTHAGYSNLALRTGVIRNGIENTNNYAEGNKIRVVTGENGIHYCHRKAPDPDLIGRNETGSMILDCLALSGYEQGEFVEASGDSVRRSLNQVENEQYYSLDYTGTTAGTTYFAISGTIGNVQIQTNPYRSSGITVIIDDEAPTVELTSNGSGLCTTGNIYTITGTFSEPVIDVNTGVLTATNGTIETFNPADQGNTYVWTVKSNTSGIGTMTAKIPDGAVHDQGGNGNTASNTISRQYDYEGPTFDISDVTGQECSRGTATISNVAQIGCASGLELAYSWNGGNFGNSISYSLYNNNTGEQSILVKVRDALGNITQKTVTYKWTDVEVVGNDFTVTGVGTGKTVNWKDLSNANAGTCETITASIYSDGLHGTCTISGNEITYAANEDTNEDGCYITLTDGDGTKNIIVTREDIDTTELTCEIAQDACTSGDLQLTLTANKPILIPEGWTLQENTNNTKFTKTVNYNGNITANVTGQEIPQTTSCTTEITNYDHEGPTFTFNNNSGYECTGGKLTITNVSATGCAYGSYTYKFNNGSWQTTRIHNISAQNAGTVTVTGYVRDSVGNITSKTATYTFNDVQPTANNFTLNNIGNTVRTGNWKTLSNAKEGDCGNGELTATVTTQATKGNCSINGNIITYTPNQGQTGEDTCVITIKDNENSTVNVTVSINGIDTVPPTCSITQSSCTSGAVILTLIGSENITVNGWTTSDGITYTTGVTYIGEISAIVTDLVGNTGSCNTGVTNYDKTGPIGSIDITYNGNQEYATGTTLNLSLTANDQGCSTDNGTIQMQFRCDNNSEWSDEEEFTETKDFSLEDYTNAGCTTQDGDKKIYVRYIDSVGNVSPTYSDTITLDTGIPTITIETTKNLKTTSQRMTGTCVGATKYYIGNNSTPEYTTINSNGYSSGIEIRNTGTYYVFCQDDAGNMVSGNKTYYNYTVYNLLEKIEGNSGTYNTLNYDIVSSLTYLAPKGTSLAPTNIYTIPTGASNRTFKGMSTGIPTNNSILISNNITPILNGNSNYSMWFARKTYTLKLTTGTGVESVNNGGLNTTDAITYKYGKEVVIDADLEEGYSWKNWTIGTTQTVYSGIKNITITITGNLNLKANATDQTAPTNISITTTNNINATGQTATLSCTDGAGVTSYYWGTTQPTSNSTYTPIESTTSFSTDKTVNASGTYYFACKDAAGNTSEIKSITYVKYQVKNMLDKIDGTAGTYTTDNYEINSTKPTENTYYVISGGISLTLRNLCTVPSEPSTLKITSIGNPGAGISLNIRTGNADNAIYACRYNREIYELLINGDSGIEGIAGHGEYKYGKSVAISATPQEGYNFSYWQVEYGSRPDDITSPTTNVTITGNTKLKAISIDSSKPFCTWGTPIPRDIKGNEGGTITLTCNDNGGIQTDILTSEDIEYSDNLIILSNATTGGTELNKTFTFTYTGKVNVNGTTNLKLKDNKIFDNENNSGTTAYDSEDIRVDNINPYCQISGGPTSLYIKSGDQGTISFTCTSTGSVITTTELGNNAIEYSGYLVNLSTAETGEVENGIIYTYTYEGKAGANGKTIFKLKAEKVSDAAGNTNSEGEDSIQVTVDNILPICTISGNPTNWTNTGVTLTLSMIDTNEDENGYKRDYGTYGNTNTLYVSTNGTHTGYVKDLAGNENSCSTGVTKIDTSEVTTEIISPDEGEYQYGNFNVSISDSGGVSGLSGCFYSINNGEVNTRTCNSDVEIDITTGCNTPGENTCIISAYATNKAGTTGNTATRSFSIDASSGSAGVGAPVIYSGKHYNNYFKGTIDIRAQITGANTCEYIINNEEWINGTISGNYCLATGIDKTQDITIQFRIITIGSNIYTGNTATFQYDNTAPVLRVKTVFISQRYNSGQTSIFTFEDTGVGISGTNTTECTIDGEGTGLTCYVENPGICDYLGNCNNTRATSSKVNIDMTPPFLLQSIDINDKRYNSSKQIVFMYEDLLSGISGSNNTGCTIEGEGTGLTCSVENPGICDKAGNCNNTTATSNKVNIDMTDPICGTREYEPGQLGRTTGNVTGTLINSTDTLSQINPQYSGGSCTITNENGTCTITIKDIAGNTTGCTTENVTWIDRTGPSTGTIQINNGDPSTSSPEVTLTLYASDAGVGQMLMRFSCDEDIWSIREDYATGKDRNLETGSGCTNGTGEKTVYVQYIDGLGNGPLTASDDINYSTDRPSCTITGTILIMSGSTGTITVHCTDANGITTTKLTGGDLIYSGYIINVGESNTIPGNQTEKTFTFTFTGEQAGISNLALKTGVVHNENNGNNFAQGNNINVIDGSGNSIKCYWGDPHEQTILRGATGYMVLVCPNLGNTTISTSHMNKIKKLSGDSAKGNFETIIDDIQIVLPGDDPAVIRPGDDTIPVVAGDESIFVNLGDDSVSEKALDNTKGFKLIYQGERTGTTQFAIDGTIGNVHFEAEPYRSSEINVIISEKLTLKLIPETSGWTNNNIHVGMIGENATNVRYYKTGNSKASYGQCKEYGTKLIEKDGTTYEGQTDVTEEGTTYIYLCGESTKTGMKKGTYMIDKTSPTFELSGTTDLYECQTGTAEIINANGGLSGLPENAYNWNNQGYGNNLTYDVNIGNSTGTENISVTVKDNAGNTSGGTITFTRQDVTLTLNETSVNLGTITGTKTRNLISDFGPSAGICETITGNVIETGNATCTINNQQVTIIPANNYSGDGHCTIEFTDGETTKTGTYTFTVDTTEPGGQTEPDELELTLNPESTNGWTGNYINVTMTATNASSARYILTGTSLIDINTCKGQGIGLTETNIHTYGKEKYINTTGINYLYLCGESLTGQFKMISGTYMINTETPGGNTGIQLYASNSSTERKTGDIDITLYVDGINITASKYITGNEIKSFEDCMTYGIDFQNSDQITRDTETETTGYLTLCASNQAGKTGYRPFIYKLDKSDPICGTTWTYEPDLDTWTNSGITATLAGSTDDISGIETAGGTCTITENNTTCDITIRDIAGRTKACTSSGTVNKIDKTKPTLTVIYSNDNTCTSGNVTITLSGSDNNELPEAPYKRDNENNWTGNNTKTVTENTSGTGYIRDIAGNMTQVQYTVTSIVKTGPGKPILTSPTNGQNYTQGNISYSWNESTPAGCANIASYTIKVYSGGNIIISGTTSNTNRNPNITLPNGSYRRKVTAKDSLGFETDSDENTFTINDQAPSCEIGYSTKQITNGDVYAFLKNCSNGATGFNKTGQLFENNGRFEFTFNNGEGITGNARAEVTWIDKVKPECTLTPSNTSLTNSNITLTAEIVERHPDKYSWTGFNNMDSSIGTLTVTQNGTYRLYLKDRAGNTGSCSIGISNIDKTAPVCGTRQYSPDSLTSGNVEVVLTGSTDDRAINITGGSCTITGENSRCTITISDRAGNTTGCVSDIVTWIDKTAPILEEVTPVDTTTDDNTPDYTFSSTESGTITYGGSCSSNTTVARSGNNTITFRKLDDGRYTDCTITVTDDAGNVSNTLEVSPFTIKTSTPERDYCPEGDYSDSFYDGTCLGSHKSDEIRDICKVDESNYTNEMKLAYIYSYTYGMTTMCPIDNANLDGKLRRDHLAKILSQYAMNVLDLEPERGKAGCDSYNDIAHESAEMKYYMKTACELGLMGLKSDGDTPMESFYPHGIVTRGEFGTTLSRLIYGDEYNLESEAQNTYEGAWYSRHLAALKRDGIMNEIYGDWPKYFEKRGYVMLMIMRHGKARLDNVGDSKSTIISDSKILSMYNENKELTCEISYFNANENGTGMLYIKNNKIREDLYTNVEGRNSTIYKNDSIYVWGDGVGNGKGISMEYETTAKEELQSLLDEEGYTLKNCKGSVNNNSVFDLPDDIEFIGMGDWFYMLGDYLEGLAGNTTK